MVFNFKSSFDLQILSWFNFELSFGLQNVCQPDERIEKEEEPTGQTDQLKLYVEQLEEVIRIKEESIDRLTNELSHVRDQSAQLDTLTNTSLAQKEDRIEELEEALRESVRITADREVALDAETQQRNLLDQKVTFYFIQIKSIKLTFDLFLIRWDD